MYLYGASGHCKVIIDILKKNKIKIESIFDDNESINKIFEFSVVKFNNQNISGELLISIGNNAVRKQLVNELKHKSYGKAIDPKAIISSNSTIKEGTVVMANAIINTSAEVGKHCIVNSAAVVEHDCKLDNFVHVSPSVTICGGVQIGEGTHIGAGTTIIPNIKIGKWCTIGAGSVVIKDVSDGVTVVGNPAKEIKINSEK